MACVFVLAACQSTGNTPENSPVKPDSHNARIALDVEGRYEVGKPVAGNDIREIRIKSGNRYAVTLANGINVSGLYTWDISGNPDCSGYTRRPEPLFRGREFPEI